jgi:uncharacterized protein YgiM (DUF1202 family)
MNRRMLLLAMIILPCLLLLVGLQLRVDAAPTSQLIRDTRPESIEPEPLAQPITVTIRQQTPLTLTWLADIAATLADLPPTMPVTLTFEFQLALTQTLTSTAPSTITLLISDDLALSWPITLALGAAPSATVVITAATVAPQATATPTEEPTPEAPTATPSPTPSPTEEVTPTSTATPTLPLSPTGVITDQTPVVSSRVNITANLRADPSVDAAIVGTAALGQAVVVTALSADGAWYLLNNGAWIAVPLLDNAPANPPLVDEGLLTSVRATATAQASTIITEPVAATPTPVGLLIPTPTATPQPIPPTVTVNGNLRSGPGLEFPIIGGTIAGDPVIIVARNEAGDWYLLSNGGWLAAFLVANPPNNADVPVFGQEQPAAPPTEPITASTTVTETAPVTETTPATTTEGATTTPVTLGISDNLYLVDANELIARYERALAQIDQLIAQAGQNEALLQDQTWVQQMTTVIALLHATDARARSLTPTSLLQTVHNDLLAAADAYDAASVLLAEGVDQRQPDRFDEAFAQITLGNVRLTSAQDGIEALTP